MDPRDFQRLAERLAGIDGSAERRSAISRCYYATFHVAMEHLRAMRFPIGKGAAAHGEVQRCLINSGSREVMQAGASMQQLHTHRIRADYDLARKDAELSTTANSAVVRARDSIAMLDSAFAGAARASIQAAITKWRHDNGYP